MTLQRTITTLTCVAALAAALVTLTTPCPAADTDYAIGIDDVLDITILHPDKMAFTVIVSPDGSITVPYIGNVQAKGVTLASLQELIQTNLADGYMKYPVVSVSLREVRSKKFFVYGEVMKPGTYMITDKDTTVMKAVTMAGGFTRYGSSGTVKVLRPKKDAAGYDTINIDMKAAMKGSSEANIALEPEDTVVVSEGKFYVYGDVARPGGYPMEENTAVLKAISTAGGFIKYSASSRVKVLRPKTGTSGTDTIDVDVKAAMNGSSEADISLQPGDTVMVTEEKYYVYGEVNRPGVYSLEDNTTILKAISVAGGLSKFGSSSRVKVLRPKKDTAGYDIIKVNMKGVLDGSPSDDIVIQPGDTVVVEEGVF